MALLVSDHLFNGLEPLVITTRIFGIMPSKNFKKYKLNIIISCIWLCFILVLLGASIKSPLIQNNDFKGSLHLILVLIDYALTVTSLNSVIVSLITLVYRSENKILQLFQNIAEIDLIWKQTFNLRQNYKKLRRNMWLLNLFALLVVFYTYQDLLLLKIQSKDILVLTIFHFVGKCVIQTAMTLFLTEGILIYARFKQINLLYTAESDKMNLNVRNIKLLFDTHIILRDSIKIMDNIFSPIVFSMILNIMFCFTSCTFRLFLNFSNKTVENTTLFELRWVSSHIVTTLLIYIISAINYWEVNIYFLFLQIILLRVIV